MSSAVETATEIRPFHVDVPEEELVELRRRIAATRWPEQEPVADLSQGVQLATMQALVRYWSTEYDFERVEARLNALPQFMTEIDGLDTRDEALDNVTLYWLTNTDVSSSRLYWENKLGFFDFKGVTVPAAVTVFPNELYQAPRAWAEQAFPNLIYFNQVDRGNHFAAWQEPDIFATEVRAAFRSLR